MIRNENFWPADVFPSISSRVIFNQTFPLSDWPNFEFLNILVKKKKKKSRLSVKISIFYVLLRVFGKKEINHTYVWSFCPKSENYRVNNSLNWVRIALQFITVIRFLFSFMHIFVFVFYSLFQLFSIIIRINEIFHKWTRRKKIQANLLENIGCV